MAGGHRRAVGSRTQRRLWSGLLGAALLVAGIRRQPEAATHREKAPRMDGNRAASVRRNRPAAWCPLRPASRSSHFLRCSRQSPRWFPFTEFLPIRARSACILMTSPRSCPAGRSRSSAISSRALPLAEKARSARLSFFTLGLSLWSANAGIKALFDGLNIVYDAQERRGLVKLDLISLAFTGGALLILLLAIAAIVVLPVALEL